MTRDRACRRRRSTCTWGRSAAPRRLPPAGHRLPDAQPARRRHGLHRPMVVRVALVCEDDIDRPSPRGGQHRGPRRSAARRPPRRGPRRGHRSASRIPIAGGLAGGSADAAAALVALDRLWDLQTSDDDLLVAGRQLGSDVPFALVGGTALGRRPGRAGHAAARTRRRAGGSWCPPRPVCPRRPSTATSTSCAPTRPGAHVRAPRTSSRPSADPDNRVLAAALRNDLEAAAIDLRPELGELIEAGAARRRAARHHLRLRARPACSCAPTGLRRPGAYDAARRRATRVLVALGPVAGTHVVEYADG